MNDHANATDEFQQRIERVETLIHEIDAAAPEPVRAATQEMVRTLIELHGEVLGRIIEQLNIAGEPGRRILETCMRDARFESVLLLHGLHPQDVNERLSRALDQLRASIQAQGGDIKLLAIDDGTVRLRLTGADTGCASTVATLKSSIEQTVYGAAPEIATVEIEGAEPPVGDSGFVQVRLPNERDAAP